MAEHSSIHAQYISEILDLNSLFEILINFEIYKKAMTEESLDACEVVNEILELIL